MSRAERLYGYESGEVLSFKIKGGTAKFFFKSSPNPFSRLVAKNYSLLMEGDIEKENVSKDLKMLHLIEKLNTKFRLKPFLKEIEKG